MTALVHKITALIEEKIHSFETPCYVFDLATLTQRIHSLKAALGTPVVMSLKANPNIDLNLRIAHSQPEIEVASLRELNLVAKATLGPVYINNPSMDRNLIRAGLGAKAHFVVDSPAQLRTIMDLAGTRPVNPLLLRLNTNALKDFVDKPVALRADHFGMDWPAALAAVDTIRATDGFLKFAGFHLFTGSHTFTKNAFALVEAAPKMIAVLEQRYGAPLTTINLGGGFSERWDEEEFDFSAYRKHLKKIPPHVAVLHESGRGFFGTCGVFLTTVVTTKSIGDRDYAVCDGGMNQNFLLCQTENHFRRPREAIVIRRAATLDVLAGTTTLVGSTCSRDDIIGQAIGAPLNVGDICAFTHCGAYHSTYTVSPFLGLKEAHHYVIP